MLPDCPSDNFADHVIGHTVLSGEVTPRNLACGVPLADRSDARLGQFCRSVPLSNATASLGYTVGSIFGVGADKQMLRIDARGIVAVVADEQTGGDRSIVKFVSDSVGGRHTPSTSTNSDAAIAFRISGPNPDHAAAFRQHDVFVESFKQRGAWLLRCLAGCTARSGAKTPPASLDLICPGFERFAAEFAKTLDAGRLGFSHDLTFHEKVDCGQGRSM